MKSDKAITWALLLFLIVVYSLTRGYVFSHKLVLQNDEALSLLNVKGTYPAYQTFCKSKHYNQWYAADSVKQAWLPAQNGSAHQVRISALTADIHPPLYFQLLHLCMKFGNGFIRSGLLLNLLLELLVITMLAIGFYKSGFTTNSILIGLCLFVIHPVIYVQFNLLRSYYSLAFLGVSLFLLVWNFRFTWYWVLMLFVVSIAGFYTHHLFGLVVCSILSGVFLTKSDLSFGSMARIALPIILPLVLLAMFDPLWLAQVTGSGHHLLRFNAEIIPTWPNGIFRGFMLHRLTESFPPFVAFGLLIGLLYFVFRLTQKSQNPLVQSTLYSSFFFILLFSIGVFTGLFPNHVMRGSQYYFFVLPMFFILADYGIKLLDRWKLPLTIAICTAVLITGRAIYFSNDIPSDSGDIVLSSISKYDGRLIGELYSRPCSSFLIPDANITIDSIALNRHLPLLYFPEKTRSKEPIDRFLEQARSNAMVEMIQKDKIWLIKQMP